MTDTNSAPKPVMEIGKTYRIRGSLLRVVDIRAFGGIAAITEMITKWRSAAIEAVPYDHPDAVEVSDEEWQAALKEANAKREKMARAAQAKIDAADYGVRVEVWHRGESYTATIVRCTATLYVDSNGRQYSRNDGCRTKDRWETYRIGAAGLDALAEVVGDRQRVDIVGERKKAAAKAARHV